MIQTACHMNVLITSFHFESIIIILVEYFIPKSQKYLVPITIKQRHRKPLLSSFQLNALN